MSKLFKTSKSPELYDDFILPISNLIGDICRFSINDWIINRKTINKMIAETFKTIEGKFDTKNLKQNKDKFHNAIITDRIYRVKGFSGLSTANATFAYLYDKYLKQKTVDQKPINKQFDVINDIINVFCPGNEDQDKITYTLHAIKAFIMSSENTGYHPVLFYLVFMYGYCLYITYFVNTTIEAGNDCPILDTFYISDIRVGEEPWMNKVFVKNFINGYYTQHKWNFDELNVSTDEIYDKYWIHSQPIMWDEVMTPRDKAINCLIILLTIMYYYSKPRNQRQLQQIPDNEWIVHLKTCLLSAEYNILAIKDVLKYSQYDETVISFVIDFFKDPELSKELKKLYVQQIIPTLTENIQNQRPINTLFNFLSKSKYYKEIFSFFFEESNFRAANIYYNDFRYVYIPFIENKYIAVYDDIFDQSMKQYRDMPTVNFGENRQYARSTDLNTLLENISEFGLYQLKGGHTAIELFELIIILIVIIIVIVVAIYVVKRFTMKRPCQKYN